jgi:hypothetical protein
VFYPLNEKVRSALVVLAPSAAEKDGFLKKLHKSIEHITEFYVSYPKVR